MTKSPRGVTMKIDDQGGWMAKPYPFLKEIARILEKEPFFVLATHVNPDADGLASVLAMALALRKKGKEVLALVEEEPPRFLAFLHGYEILRLWTEPPEAGSLARSENSDFPLEEAVALVFDLSEEDRLGELAHVIEKTKLCVVFDHHALTGNPVSEIRMTDPEAPATTFLVLELLEYLGWPLTPEIAENLYAGLYSDTGGFRFEKTREETFLAAAHLVKHGARPPFVGEKLLENHPPARFELLARVLSRKEFLGQGQAVLSYLSLNDFEEVGASPAEAEDFATFLRSIRGIEVSALIKEIRPGEVGVSLRSRGRIDVARLAAEEGGGGHVRAAGFRKRGWPLEEVMALVRQKLVAVLEEKDEKKH